MEANRRSRWPSKPERGYWLIRFSVAGLIVGFVGGLVLSGGLILLGVLSALIVAGLFAGIGAAIDAPKWAGGGALVGLFLSMLASIALYFRFSANPEQGFRFGGHWLASSRSARLAGVSWALSSECYSSGLKWANSV